MSEFESITFMGFPDQTAAVSRNLLFVYELTFTTTSSVLLKCYRQSFAKLSDSEEVTIEA